MSALVSTASRLEQASAVLPESVWRASQMGSYRSPIVPTGFPAFDNELPDGGWPASSLIELLPQQPGIGEMRLLRPALGVLARKRRMIVLVQPPHLPHIAAWTAWGLPAELLLWVKPQRSADALWTAEQVLRNGSCGALLLWQTHVRSESLRRLQLAAQHSDTLFWMMRPLACTQDASPSPLRLALRPAAGGIAVEIVKRRGPRRDDSLFVALDDLAPELSLPDHVPTSSNPSDSPTSSDSSDALLDRPAPAAAAARNGSAALV